jgi:anaerobic magnesium-protoporphyrin IX monomethyl ester cyclase
MLSSNELEKSIPSAQASPSIRRVLLVSLPVVLAPGEDSIGGENVLHLSLAYLATILRENGYHAHILDCYAENMDQQRPVVDAGFIELGLRNEEIIERIVDFSPDLIGITIPFSCQHYIALDVAMLIKNSFPSIPVVGGGNHVTAVPEIIDPDCFDYLIIGEGEFAFLDLLNSLNQGKRVQGIPGIYGSGLGYPGYIKKLDDIPFPSLDLMPLSKLWHSRRRWINMIATRGCVFDCNFCSIHTVMGYPIRRRSVGNVIAEITHWKDQYNIQEIYFEDDNLTANKRWTKELFQRIADLNLGIRFYARNGIRADTVDTELLKLMKAVGFHDFMIAPESGSQKTLDEIIGKKMKLKDCEEAIKFANEVGLGVNVFFILGFPGETWRDLEETVRYANYLKQLGAVGFWFSTATPYPGTRLYAECVEKGLIDLDTLDFRRLRTSNYVIKHPIFTDSELKAFRQKAMDDLAPRRSLAGKARKSLSLLKRDPSFFFTKLKYKLNYYF